MQAWLQLLDDNFRITGVKEKFEDDSKDIKYLLARNIAENFPNPKRMNYSS